MKPTTTLLRDATLTIDEKERCPGAWHRFADGLPFVRVYVVPTGPKFRLCFPGMSQSLGRWRPDRSSAFLYQDTRSGQPTPEQRGL